MRALLTQMVQETEFQLEASKGGNVPGVTEDHRYEMLESLQSLRSTIADLSAAKRCGHCGMRVGSQQACVRPWTYDAAKDRCVHPEGEGAKP